jgi:hypothetical protein
MNDLVRKLLQRAVIIAGDETRLRSLLRVDEHALSMWMDGRADPPQRVFLALVDLVLEDDLARAAQDRRREPRGDIMPIRTSV